MSRLASLFALSLLSLSLAGCGDSPPPPPAENSEANLPDEVREAEGAFRDQAKQHAEGKLKKAR